MRNASLLRRIERLERAIAPQKLATVRRYDPRSQAWLDPIPDRPWFPEPFYPSVEAWEAAAVENLASLKAADKPRQSNPEPETRN